jgi:hypothetical protein
MVVRKQRGGEGRGGQLGSVGGSTYLSIRATGQGARGPRHRRCHRHPSTGQAREIDACEHHNSHSIWTPPLSLPLVVV